MSTTYSVDPGDPDPSYLTFWRERHLCTLTTLRPDGTPHVVPVGVTYDPAARLARVITNKSSAKVRHLLTAGPAGAPVAVCQVAGKRWATLEGRAFVRTERERVAEAERRYAERYERTPAPNPSRVVIEIELTRALGRG
ncbi:MULTISPECIES: pyridoxamine 5'-phosphate oxidase family protein [Streptomyces]|uniref:TIGR03618 family F420-dependent PPOX class oxidoreductase n=1 Tax=Streptomyces cadmiisoli TaxID=2184053 RepID=A0A2Z4J0J4_9ACTN|nr:MULTISPECIES: TIGR03618 family F420-dependent PPOX class oxidoreductase [Streptomyces]AWW38484.1 TIGR03618 family F420-dependent PPOX class oxidoreductase [Streptomyces cadmiisoli]KOV73753.1 nitrilase [Streptomyces sp. AS58]